MGSHSVICHPTEVRISPLPPAEAGTQFSDPDECKAEFNVRSFESYMHWSHRRKKCELLQQQTASRFISPNSHLFVVRLFVFKHATVGFANFLINEYVV